MMAALPMLMGMMGQGQQQDQQRLSSVTPDKQQMGSAGGQGMSGGNALSALATLGQNQPQAQGAGGQPTTGPVPNPTNAQGAGANDMGNFLMKLLASGS